MFLRITTAVDWAGLAVRAREGLFLLCMSVLVGLWFAGIAIAPGLMKLLALVFVPYAVYVSIGEFL